MEIEIGKRVVASTGKHIGNVDHIVLNSETNAFSRFIVRQGVLLSRDRMIEPALVDRVEADGTVHLNIDEDRVNQLFEFMRGRIEPNKVDDNHDSQMSALDEDLTIEMTAPTRLGPMAVAYERRPKAVEDFLDGSIHDKAMSNLPPNEIVLDYDSKVVDRDGRQIGGIEAVTYKDDGSLVSLVVRTGHLVHHSRLVLANGVASVSNKGVLLNISKEEVERE